MDFIKTFPSFNVYSKERKQYISQTSRAHSKIKYNIQYKKSCTNSIIFHIFCSPIHIQIYEEVLFSTNMAVKRLNSCKRDPSSRKTYGDFNQILQSNKNDHEM